MSVTLCMLIDDLKTLVVTFKFVDDVIMTELAGSRLVMLIKCKQLLAESERVVIAKF